MNTKTFTVVVTDDSNGQIIFNARVDSTDWISRLAGPEKPRPLGERARLGAYVYEGREGQGGLGDPWHSEPHLRLERRLGRRLDPVSSFINWDVLFNQIPWGNYADRDHLISWHPDKRTARDILSGRHDPFLDAWGRQAGAWARSKLYVRLMPEMNGSWANWSPLRTDTKLGGMGIRSAAEYKAVYQHVVDRVREHAPGIKWVWCPNVTDEPYRAGNFMEDFYPGHAWVDIVGFDAYNWGSDDGDKWTTFDQLVGTPVSDDPDSIYDRLRRIGDGKPIWICELSSSEAGDGDKARWMADMLECTDFPLIEAVVMFSVDKERDWRLDSSDSSVRAWRESART